MKIPTWNKVVPLLGFILLFLLLFSSRTAVPDVAAEESAPPARMPGHFLTGPNRGEPLEIALAYLRSSASEYGLTEEDVSDVVVTANYLSDHNGVTHIHTRQRVNGIEINGAVANLNIARDGSVISMGNRYVSDAASMINATTPSADPMTAVEYAADYLALEITEPLAVRRSIGGVARETVITKGGISLNEIPVKLMYHLDQNGELRLAWEMVIYELDAYHWWHMWVDAETGDILDRYDWVTHDDFGIRNYNTEGKSVSHTHTYAPSSVQRVDGATYNVFPYPVESPIHGDRAVVTNPAASFNPPFDASPFGWHDDDGVEGADYTTTRGNNTHAYEDLLVPNVALPGSDADGGADLIFDFPFNQSAPFITYQDAAVTNLFYWTNLNHDIYYQYGFNEVAGNFQENNYGRGGVGGDYVFAEAQDGSGTDNANFATPADGSNPRMQMYIFVLFAPGETKDGDFDAGIIAHEYGHGISIRLTGGPSDVGCMNHEEREGEGWSDWLGLVLTTQPEHTAETPRGVGSFAVSQPPDGPGIRSFPYTTDMSINGQTYADIADAAVPHGVGSIWATMIWDLYWAYVDKYGYDANVYNAAGTAGNQRVIQLVMDGMKMQVCDPTFTEARDAILAAEKVLTGGENECMIWEVFARRGLGFSANAGSETSATDGTESFDLPPLCIPQFEVEPQPQAVNVCAPANGVYTVGVKDTTIGYTEAVTLSVANLPAELSAVFDSTIVGALPGSTSLTIGNTGSIASGRYDFDIVGDSGTEVNATSTRLNIADAAPAVVTLTQPADGLVTDNLAPIFFWEDVALAAHYELEVATSADFSNIVYSATSAISQHTMQNFELSFSTTYYWRVRAINGCGDGVYSPLQAFSTVNDSCVVYDSSNVPLPITGPAGIASTLEVDAEGSVTDVNVTTLEGFHTHMGGVRFNLQSPAGTNVVLLNPACDTDDGFDIKFDDQAPIGEAPCPPTDGGVYQPAQSLTKVQGENSQGTWTLKVDDQFVNTTGTLNAWSIEVCTGEPADYSDSVGSYGRANHTGDGALLIGTGWDADLSFSDDQDDDNDDGVTFADNLEAGQPYELTVDVSGTAADGIWLTVYADLNDDGDFVDANEELFDAAGVSGANVINGTIPAGATFDNTVEYRVRLYDSASDPTASPTGVAAGGEVQDGTATGSGTPTVATLQSAETAPNHTTLLIVISVILLGLIAVRVQRD